jgi:hypothetical protein
MNRPAFAAFVQSKAFGIVCYSVLVGLAVLYYYLNFVRATPPGELNISCFAYRDINRNGIYDMDDRPYAGLKISIARRNGDKVTVESNTSGFTNFPMSLSASGAIIRKPGEYTIEVNPPSGWKVTSGNPVQTSVFRRLEGSPSGLVAEKTFAAVGIAPDLSISGTLRGAAGTKGGGILRAVSPKGDVNGIPVDDAGFFSLPVDVGGWRIEYEVSTGPAIVRNVLVKDCPVVLSSIGPTLGAADIKRTDRKADFDTLTTSDTLYEIPNGYAGLNWTNWVATHQKYYGGAGYVNAALSSEYVAYNSSGHPAIIWSNAPFDFVGAHITAAWPNAENYGVVIRAWRNTDPAHEDRIKVRTAGPIHFIADYRNITKLEFSTETFWQIAIDDFEFRTD